MAAVLGVMVSVVRQAAYDIRRDLVVPCQRKYLNAL